MTAAEASLGSAKALQQLEPHGRENPKALFLLRGLEWDGRAQAVGERGLKLKLRDGSFAIDAIGWTLAERPHAERRGRFDVAANLHVDSYTELPTLSVLDLGAA